MINKLRALNSWYTKGLDNGSHLRVAINSAESIAQLRETIEAFFLQPQPDNAPAGGRLLAASALQHLFGGVERHHLIVVGER